VNHPLPIVPPRLAHEALGCWVDRTAQVYEMAGHQLMDYWAVPLPLVHDTPINLDARAATIPTLTLTRQMRISNPSPSEADVALGNWLTQHGDDAPICPICLLEDDHAGRTRYRRCTWNHAWLTHCLQHEQPLVRIRDWSSASILIWKTPSRHHRGAAGRLERVGRTPPRQSWPHNAPVGVAMDAVREMERVIAAAIHGRKPRKDRWGNVTAAQFLAIVSDVTALSLTRFDDSPSLCTLQLGWYMDDAPVRFFARLPKLAHRRYTRHGLETLATVGDVGLRRGALFWARELMCIGTARPWLDRRERTNRRLRLNKALALLPIEGLGWLAQQSLHWPEEYRERWWGDMAAISGG
jgi:hypothetical protein